jgi:hypothetical protein
MKAINNYIFEKLKINKSNFKKTKLTLFPETLNELLDMIQKEIQINGNECSLNHIDTSKVTNMSRLFADDELGLFDGNISMWDTSNVTDMTNMFCNSKFTGKNGDISNWDVSKVENMNGMFYSSRYDGNLSKWNTSNVIDMFYMFSRSNFTGKKGDISKWDVSNVINMASMFENSSFCGDLSNWNIKSVKTIQTMFSFSRITTPPTNWNTRNLIETLHNDDFAYLYNTSCVFKGTLIEENNLIPDWYKYLQNICELIFIEKEQHRKILYNTPY